MFNWFVQKVSINFHDIGISINRIRCHITIRAPQMEVNQVLKTFSCGTLHKQRASHRSKHIPKQSSSSSRWIKKHATQLTFFKMSILLRYCVHLCVNAQIRTHLFLFSLQICQFCVARALYLGYLTCFFILHWIAVWFGLMVIPPTYAHTKIAELEGKYEEAEGSLAYICMNELRCKCNLHSLIPRHEPINQQRIRSNIRHPTAKTSQKYKPWIEEGSKISGSEENSG